MTFITPTSIINYVKSQSFQYFIPDWLLATFLICFFFIVEHSPPFQRQFSITNLKISHPFSIDETITGPECIIISTFIPLAIITLVILVKNYKNKYQSSHQALHILQISILSLLISLSLSGVITDILKNWIARHRPDFLSRCVPKIDTPRDILVGIDVCTNPYGDRVLMDGMRSTPSGHSSISFAGLGFLSIWLSGQFKLFKKGDTHYLYKYILVSFPIGFASFIALSRTQDYRHHFEDIIIGTILGCIFAFWSYNHYFNDLTSEKCETVIENGGDDNFLPL
ncbi:unnamed protein product [Candida verbasci]|uniref:Phosphatidic acid phosphatase type 2/haloperoxidase domain-containing protein n=1 Tax=Candida verbasci TaxID=1227364 RepID=A0A9W4TTB3_9ASCO|nr:unnamed protein product [Candida verbasci]